MTEPQNTERRETEGDAPTVEQSAQRIAGHGREALLSRLRPAFSEAAREHADLLDLGERQLEEMVQRAADRADGLQWRRALAAVASEQLQISLGAALSHPAVARAQEIVGAPSYEDSLRALGVPEPEAAFQGAVAAGDEEQPSEPAGVRTDPDRELAEHEEDQDAQPEREAPFPEQESRDASEPLEMLRLAAVHLGGIANLAAGEQQLELRIGADGLDIARKPGRVLGRLRWREINALEVPAPKGLRRRRRTEQAHLLIRTEHGDATFEIPAVSEEELRGALEPLLARHATR